MNARIQANIDASAAAESAFEFIESEWQNVPPRFWERLQKLIAAKLPARAPATASEDMSHVDAMRFEQQTMPRGRHALEIIAEVPCEYLAWWADSSLDDFTKTLRKYVRSARFRERERMEG